MLLFYFVVLVKIFFYCVVIKILIMGLILIKVYKYVYLFFGNKLLLWVY